jgi:transposase
MMPGGIVGHRRRRPCPGARPRARAVALNWGIFSQHFRGEFTQQLHLVLLAKRLEKGRFIWPTIAREGVVTLTTAQLAMLLEGLDWRMPTPSWRPEIAV